MKAKENVHEGHRERMIKKLLEGKTSFLDHELMEMLLFYAIPRIDTNPLAHKVVSRFGTLDNVFSASKEELLSVEGVGEKTANLIVLIGEIMKRTEDQRKDPPRFLNFYQSKKLIKEMFEEQSEEYLFALLLDKKHQLIAKLEFSDHNTAKVSADASELSRAIAVHKPKFVILTHNHSSGSVAPSRDDDVATMKINLLCEVHGVSLVDHIIYSKGEFFSYFNSQRIDFVKADADINKLLSSINKE